MAGIGFELKKLFNTQSITGHIKGFAYASMISAGPMLICVLMLILISAILKLAGTSVLDRELLNSIIMYAFIFALINVSGLSMVVSRYLADELFINNTNNVLASLAGVLSINTLVGGIAGLLFFIISPLTTGYRLITYILFIELTILYQLMVYISAIKEYKKIIMSFIVGVVVTIISSLLLSAFSVRLIIAILIGVILGFFINLLIQLVVIRQTFAEINDSYFLFLKTFKRMPQLYLINFFYTLGLYCHNILFWHFSDLSTNIQNTFYYAPAYDNAAFLSFLTILPAIVIYIVKVETSFYQDYRYFCHAILTGGRLNDIEQSKEKMIKTLRRELYTIFEIQLIATIILLISGVFLFLPLLGVDSQTIELYSVLSIGYFLTYMSFIVVNILLYFDNQQDSVMIMGFFLIVNILLSLITINLGEQFYGLGLGISALLTLIIGLRSLEKTMVQIDFRLFSVQP